MIQDKQLYIVIGSGESYNSRLVYGNQIAKTISEFINGLEWINYIEEIKKELQNPNNWSNSYDGVGNIYGFDVGETDRIDVYRVTCD